MKSKKAASRPPLQTDVRQPGLRGNILDGLEKLASEWQANYERYDMQSRQAKRQGDQGRYSGAGSAFSVCALQLRALLKRQPVFEIEEDGGETIIHHVFDDYPLLFRRGLGMEREAVTVEMVATVWDYISQFDANISHTQTFAEMYAEASASATDEAV